MEKCVIFCAAGFDGLVEPIDSTDFIIAADGGLRHTRSLSLTPHAVIGDFDSLGFVPEGSTVFPVEKDDTDAMLAIRLGLEKGFRRFVIYGGMDGPRLDHTVANLQALAYLADHGATGHLVGSRYIATALQNGRVSFPETATGILSLFCFGEDAKGVTLEGLKYPLEKGTLSAGFPLGVSNHFMGKRSRITVEKGTLIALYDRTNGI